ncbi:hypothetical protein COR50_14205 [Chitinophaga caeni]|uniref:Uncharacterized protein n=1 Tax=Chitinophaga caeni TaxID=2029983 RepID=A0A291QWI9_9BACT|nr:hypothetical protein [Chitinophaga caeni]ATL48223.1 hypothetical protein COR50_14205 [Chitinophaga caeni]
MEGKRNSAFAKPSGKESFKNNNLIQQVEGSDPLVSVAPDIDWKIELKFTVVTPTLLEVAGNVKGKAFPAYESFIQDEAGMKVFLHTYSAPDRLQLGKELLNPSYDYRRSLSFRFELDAKGNFTGKMWLGGEKGAWNETTISAWNKLNFDKKPAPDLERGEGEGEN